MKAIRFCDSISVGPFKNSNFKIRIDRITLKSWKPNYALDLRHKSPPLSSRIKIKWTGIFKCQGLIYNLNKSSSHKGGPERPINSGISGRIQAPRIQSFVLEKLDKILIWMEKFLLVKNHYFLTFVTKKRHCFFLFKGRNKYCPFRKKKQLIFFLFFKER